MTCQRIGPLAVAIAGLTGIAGQGAAQVALPDDVQATCTVPAEFFASWFPDGPGADAPASPAASASFPTDNTVCDFYIWGARMFLWLTSPENGGRVLDGPALFNVLPANDQKVRILQENDAGEAPAFALRTEKIGEVGQAGSHGALVSQAGGLIYYGVHVNDVYGYFLTGQKGGALSQTVFPRNAQDMADIEAYLASSFPDVTLQAPETLVMEFKTSWVDAADVPDATQFITIEAEVPTYTPNTDNTVWTETGTTTTTTQLALTGIHIVGTVQNHPEFVWITYEHILNAPDGEYYYTNTAGEVSHQDFSSDGTFLFMASGGVEPQNIECAKAPGADITAVTKDDGSPVCDGGIVASDTYRQYPWGSQKGDNGTAAVTNNTLLLSLNASVRGQLASGDPRANYIQTGGIWTSAPSATADAPIPNASDFAQGDLRGSLFSFNATMETYTQGTSCFSCHNQKADAPDSFQSGQLSHIYSEIQALTPPGQ